ncbi:MAG TPA: hypothetical protein VJ123_04630 [Anaerolineales bacterium]|nr:hypothetical protein [Anaerolineales bacterium]
MLRPYINGHANNGHSAFAPEGCARGRREVGEERLPDQFELTGARRSLHAAAGF